MKFAGVFFLFLSAVSAWAFDASNADMAFAAFNTNFYSLHRGFGHYQKDTAQGNADFWKQSEEIEMIEDVYDRSGSEESRRMIIESINGFAKHYGANWKKNKFNDDIMWMTIACARGYLDTSNNVFRKLAEKNYQEVVRRGWDGALGGGIWWSTDKACKNSCINGPATIAACLLYQITGKQTYLANAQEFYAWERRTLFKPATGALHDNIGTNGSIGRAVFTYNEGTFIGAGDLLWKITGDTNYLNDAVLAADFTRNHLCRNGILPVYGPGDAAGFNGIFCRWLARLAKDNDLWPKYYDWMVGNANAAWHVRNAANLSWQNWNEPTPPGNLESWSCSGSVVVLQVVPSELPANRN